jgi:hypothetical protein
MGAYDRRNISAGEQSARFSGRGFWAHIRVDLACWDVEMRPTQFQASSYLLRGPLNSKDAGIADERAILRSIISTASCRDIFWASSYLPRSKEALICCRRPCQILIGRCLPHNLRHPPHRSQRLLHGIIPPCLWVTTRQLGAYRFNQLCHQAQVPNSQML